MARIAFCQHFFYEYIGVMLLSALLKKQGHRVEVFVSDLRGLRQAVKRKEFDLICFTMMTCDVSWALEHAKDIKKIDPDLPIAAGGPHTTIFPEFIEENGDIDIICIGEGEQAVLELAQAIDEGEEYTHINNLSVRDQNNKIVKNPLSPLIEDLDSLPFSDRQIYLKYKYFRKPTITNMIASRGCPYNCSFCFNHQFKKLYNCTKFRLRSPENIVEEIKFIQKQGFEIRLLLFVDSTFNLNLKWCEKFFKLYKKEKLNIPFSLNISAGRLNQRVSDALAATGNCQSVRFAVEVGNESIRTEVLRKPFTNKMLFETANLLRERNIPMNVNLMFGLPFETEEDVLETIKLARKIKPDFINSAIFTPYRGLEITRLSLEKGFLTEEDLKRLDDPQFSRLDSVMRLKDIDTIKNIFYFSLAMIHLPWTEPYLMKLVHFKGNGFFKSIFLVSHLLQTRKFVKIGWLRSVIESYYHRNEK